LLDFLQQWQKNYGSFVVIAVNFQSEEVLIQGFDEVCLN
jgi:phosphoribosylformimino-5-aminoimidazole carboxamide ribonucleotide (ProFAR) isomerase